MFGVAPHPSFTAQGERPFAFRQPAYACVLRLSPCTSGVDRAPIEVHEQPLRIGEVTPPRPVAGVLCPARNLHHPVGNTRRVRRTCKLKMSHPFERGASTEF